MTGELQREYAYDNARAAQGARLRTLEAIFDAGTIAELEARGGACPLERARPRPARLELGAGAFDLVMRAAAAGSPTRARRPGACAALTWRPALVDELDFASAVPDRARAPSSAERFKRMVAAHHAVIADRHGFDPYRAPASPAT